MFGGTKKTEQQKIVQSGKSEFLSEAFQETTKTLHDKRKKTTDTVPADGGFGSSVLSIR